MRKALTDILKWIGEIKSNLKLAKITQEDIKSNEIDVQIQNLEVASWPKEKSKRRGPKQLGLQRGKNRIAEDEI